MTEIEKKIHNIVASTILAPAMRHIKEDFMIGVRGYLRTSKQDDELFRKVENAAREAMERTLLEGV